MTSQTRPLLRSPALALSAIAGAFCTIRRNTHGNRDMSRAEADAPAIAAIRFAVLATALA